MKKYETTKEIDLQIKAYENELEGDWCETTINYIIQLKAIRPYVELLEEKEKMYNLFFESLDLAGIEELPESLVDKSVFQHFLFVYRLYIIYGFFYFLYLHSE